jgi:hypothetical protein
MAPMSFHDHARRQGDPSRPYVRDVGGRERCLQALGDRRRRGCRPDAVGEQPGQHVFAAEQDGT